MKIIPLPNKMIRAGVIREYYGDKRVYCFSCGHATEELRNAGVNVIAIGNKEKLNANDYINPQESDFMFNCPNVTSGCLSPVLMERISELYASIIPVQDIIKLTRINIKARVYVPVGSGETLFALGYLIPSHLIVGYYSRECPAINFNAVTPLYNYISKNYKIVEFHNAELQTINDFIVENKKGYLINTNV